jgi:fluoride exporter
LIALVAVLGGSALGGLVRFLVSACVDTRAGGRFPWGTLVVNVTGALLIGIVLARLPEIGAGNVHRLLVVGFLGSYTTVSAFSLQTVQLLDAGRRGTAAAYFFASAATCVLAAAAGFAIGDLVG